MRELTALTEEELIAVNKKLNDYNNYPQRDGKLIPIEVKSGERVGAESLKEYIRLFKPAYAIRISMKNFGCEDGIKSVPLYAVFCIHDEWSA